LGPPATSQITTVTRLMAITVGTKTALTRSASCWIGARDACASRIRRTICASVLSAPTRVARTRSAPDRSLKKLAEDTGGGYFELKKTADLGETFTRVAQELHSQYVLGFSPETMDGKVHKLDVRVKKAGMTARARKSYVAASAGTK
jgi:VWFA-related protein